MLQTASLEELSLDSAWVTIGSFDGVHTGHQALLRRLVAGARSQGVPAVVLTFHPHPAVVLRQRPETFYLTTPQQRATLLAALGVDMVITYPFTPQVASLGAEDFLNLLKRHLGLRHLCVGPNFAMGRNREGDLPTLKRLGEKMGFTLHVIPPVRRLGEVVSSSRIRALLAAGEVKSARALLGRPYAVSGEVIRGDGRGHLIGIPTANLQTPPEQLLPAEGVYACLARWQGRTLRAVTNVGVRPTFHSPNSAKPLAETHLLDFEGDLYGHSLELLFIRRLRNEQRFNDAAALVSQIRRDIREARRTLRLPAQNRASSF